MFMFLGDELDEWWLGEDLTVATPPPLVGVVAPLLLPPLVPESVNFLLSAPGPVVLLLLLFDVDFFDFS